MVIIQASRFLDQVSAEGLTEVSLDVLGARNHTDSGRVLLNGKRAARAALGSSESSCSDSICLNLALGF